MGRELVSGKITFSNSISLTIATTHLESPLPQRILLLLLLISIFKNSIEPQKSL